MRFRNFKTGAARWMVYKVLTLPDADGRPDRRSRPSARTSPSASSSKTTCAVAADLSEADRRKNEFLAMLAHELRNPLAPLAQRARSAERLGERRAGERCAARDMMERQVGQMVRLVDDLLDVSRITRDRLELRARPRRTACRSSTRPSKPAGRSPRPWATS